MLACGHSRNEARRARATELYEADLCPVCPDTPLTPGASASGIPFKSCPCCGDDYRPPKPDGTLLRFMTL